MSQVPSKVPGPRLLRFLTFFHDFCAVEKHDFTSTSQVFTLLLFLFDIPLKVYVFQAKLQREFDQLRAEITTLRGQLVQA